MSKLGGNQPAKGYMNTVLIVPTVLITPTLYTDVLNLMEKDLDPIMQMVVIVSRSVGIYMVLYAITRLHRHGHPDMMHRVSPMGTLFAFIAGAVLVMFTPEMAAFSNSIFGGGANGTWNNLTTPCIKSSGHGPPVANKLGVIYCPIMGYVKMLGQAPYDNIAIVRTLIFSILFIVGSLSFLRGWVKNGEGSGQGGLPKAITHILAGTVGINAPVVYLFLNSVSLNY